MKHDLDPSHASGSNEAPDVLSPETPPTLEELLTTLRRIERRLQEIHAAIDAPARERQHKQFSPARLIASVLQGLVVGLVGWALSDWLFQKPVDALAIKLAFAMVLQLAAATVFFLAPERPV